MAKVRASIRFTNVVNLKTPNDLSSIRARIFYHITFSHCRHFDVVRYFSEYGHVMIFDNMTGYELSLATYTSSSVLISRGLAWSCQLRLPCQACCV